MERFDHRQAKKFTPTSVSVMYCIPYYTSQSNKTTFQTLSRLAHVAPLTGLSFSHSLTKKMADHRDDNNSSSRASSETAQGADSSPSVDEFEKTSLMRGDLPSSPIPKKKKPFWRRHLVPAIVHLSIFSVYFTLGILALDSRTKSMTGNRSLLWCEFPSMVELDSHFV